MGRLFRRVCRTGTIWGEEMTEKVVWHVVNQYAGKLGVSKLARHEVWKLLRRIPFIGPIRAALIIAILQTPHRFRTKRQLWAYSGFGIETHSSADHSCADSGLWLGTMLLLAAAAVLFLASNDQKVFGQPVTSTSKKK